MYLPTRFCTCNGLFACMAITIVPNAFQSVKALSYGVRGSPAGALETVQQEPQHWQAQEQGLRRENQQGQSRG